MLNIYIGIIVFVYLVIVSIVDIRKSKAIPSLLTTGGVFFVALVNIKNIPYGILAGLLSWMLMDFYEDEYSNFLSGVADLKMTIFLGLMISSLAGFLMFCLILTVTGVLYKVVIVKLFPDKKEIPFMPTFLITYIIMILLEVFTNVQIF
jgi:hypothetical protein